MRIPAKNAFQISEIGFPKDQTVSVHLNETNVKLMEHLCADKLFEIDGTAQIRSPGLN